MRIIDGELTLSPSDLSRYLACRHLTSLELEVAHGVRARPHLREALVDLIAAKGTLHEERYLESLRSSGAHVVPIDLPEGTVGFTEAA